jgi:hypothetical protein
MGSGAQQPNTPVLHSSGTPSLDYSNIPVLQLILPLCYHSHQLSPFVVGFFIVGLEEYLMAILTAVYD